MISFLRVRQLLSVLLWRQSIAISTRSFLCDLNIIVSWSQILDLWARIQLYNQKVADLWSRGHGDLGPHLVMAMAMVISWPMSHLRKNEKIWKERLKFYRPTEVQPCGSRSAQCTAQGLNISILKLHVIMCFNVIIYLQKRFWRLKIIQC